MLLTLPSSHISSSTVSPIANGPRLTNPLQGPWKPREALMNSFCFRALFVFRLGIIMPGAFGKGSAMRAVR
jgi:hypothetical protein